MTVSLPMPARTSAAAWKLPSAPHPTIATCASSSFCWPASPIGGNRICREYRSRSAGVIVSDGSRTSRQNDPFPFHNSPMKVDQQTKALTRRAQVVQALRQMLAAQMLDTFQFDDDIIFHDNIAQDISHGY